jgi:hypothetical protein
MRYAVVILLLASPVSAAEPVYSWQTRADDPERAYLYLDGKQVGGWDYRARQYRSFDGTNWGAPTDAAPVRPPERQLVVKVRPAPIVMTQPLAPLPPLRGPLRVRLGTATTHILTDMTTKVIEEIPGAVVDSVKRGDYQLDYQFSVTRSPQQSGGQTTPPSPSQPPPGPQRRWVIPRR